jgi:uncharacterized protein with FMN-binding domain
MPRRGVIAIITTAFALVLLLSFRAPAPVTLGGTGSLPDQGIVGPPGQLRATPAPTATTNGDPGGASAGTGSGAAGSGAQANPTPNTTQAPSGKASGQYTGQVVQTEFGPVQVRIALSAGRITDVTALQLPSGHRRSAEISQYVEPMLRSEALQAQSAQIDLISGATYTSMAYAQSLQSALDQAGG